MAINSLISACPSCGALNRIPSVRIKEKARCGTCKTMLPEGAWRSSEPVNIADAEFAALISSSSLPVLVDFWAAWCGPCKTIAPALERLAAKFDGRLLVVKLDVDQNPATALQYNISSIPALILFHNGRVIDQVIGALPPRQLESWLVSHLP